MSTQTPPLSGTPVRRQDHAQARTTTGQSAMAIASRRHVRLHTALTLGFLALTFIGTRPFGISSNADRVEGNPLERLAILSLAALSLPILLARSKAALACIRANPLLVLTIALAVVSVVWSDYPGLTLRRSAVLVLISASALAIAVGIDDLRRFHMLLFAFLTGVILVNLLTIVLLPAYAISDIGVRGFYPQKNVAGIVAMLAVFLGAAWTLGARSRTETWLGRFGIAVATLFLVLSRSKTSLGIAGAVLVVGGVLLIAERCAVRLIVLSSAVILTTAAAVMFAYDIDSLQLIGTLLNDTSFTGRDLLWKFIWNTASQRTWLGYGYGAFWDVGEANDPLNKAEPGTWLGDVEKGVINEAHNGYLELWVSVGLPAAIIAVLSIIVSVRNAAGHAMQLAVRSNERSMFAATVLILIAYLLHNITESTFFLRGSTFCNLALLLQMIATRAPQPDAVRPVGLRTTTP